RPHTSPMQIRHAQAHARKHAGAATMPDVRVIAPGRTFRVDNDATHSPMFHQVEGLWLGENVSFRDLKAVYLDFMQAFFETSELKLRFRPSYFPFTEPSAEIDLMFEHGPLAGRWLEVSGSGQVHPQVVRNMGFDPERIIGFAFGSGIDRLAMLRYGIDDLRLFFDGDLRFLREFCDPPIGTAELAEKLTMAGLEVENLRAVAPPFHGVVVAKVLSVVPHPNADRLRVCEVDVGAAETLSIVCGAPNVRAGMKAPCALVGAELPPAKEGAS